MPFDTDTRSEAFLPQQQQQSTSRTITRWLHQIYTTVSPGMGLFGESYILFSVGTMQPLWKVAWSSFDQEQVLATSVMVGVISGMIGIGALAQSRRHGSIATATLMSSTAVGLTLVAFYKNARLMAALLFVFGVGVGGEYPLSAATASERAMTTNDAHRGQAVQLVFSMQGMGIFFNSLVTVLLLMLLGQTSHQYNPARLVAIWAITYAIGAFILISVLYNRFFYLKESAVWQRDKQCRDIQAVAATTAYVHADSSEQLPFPLGIHASQSPSMYPAAITMLSSMSSLSAASVAVAHDGLFRNEQYDGIIKTNTTRLFLRNYGVRLIGVSLSWMLWDGT
jgi:MFS family permease